MKQEEKIQKEESVIENTPVENEQVEEEAIEESISEDVETTTNTTKKTKKTLQKQDFVQKFEYLFSAYEDQLKAARKQPNQSVSLHKYLSQLKKDVFQILKLKKRKSGDSTVSGFMKPVDVSTELRSFLGNLPEDAEITRVLVTRKLCEYIKQQGLQQNEDKRFIIPDDKLKSLFSIAADDNDTKLSYYGIQQLIQRHISKKTVENSTA